VVMCSANAKIVSIVKYMLSHGEYEVPLILLKVKGLSDIANHVYTSKLQDVTCHMRSHSVTCHPTQVNVPT